MTFAPENISLSPAYIILTSKKTIPQREESFLQTQNSFFAA